MVQRLRTYFAMQGIGSDAWSERSHTAVTKTTHHSNRGPSALGPCRTTGGTTERPSHPTRKQTLLAATGESLRAATKTQHGESNRQAGPRKASSTGVGNRFSLFTKLLIKEICIVKYNGKERKQSSSTPTLCPHASLP